MSTSLAVRKAFLKTRAVEFTRLLMLSMLEDASDTFGAMQTVLKSELSQCNLSLDQFLHLFGDLLAELRTKLKDNEEEEPTSKEITSSQRSTINISQDAIFLPNSTPPKRPCKRCHRDLSSMKNIFKDYCSNCYYKTKLKNLETPNDQSATRLKQAGCRQCSDCSKFVPKGGVFYRSARLCKNCYERNRLMLRRNAQKQCIVCSKVSNTPLINGVCVTCSFPNNQTRSDETLNDHHTSNGSNEVGNWFSPVEGDFEQLSEGSLFDQKCRRCQKSADEVLGTNGHCCACQNSILLFKVESVDEE